MNMQTLNLGGFQAFLDKGCQTSHYCYSRVTDEETLNLFRGE